MRLLLFVAITLTTAGCSMAWPVSEFLPPATIIGPRARISPAAVKLYREGQPPDRPFAQLAKIAAHGNAYATRTTLEQTLIKEAARLGANGVIIVGQEVTRDETIGSYGGGIMVANQIKRPHLYGVAFVWQKVRLGVASNAKDGQRTVTYVIAGSPAERAGIKEGDKLLAIDGQFVGANEMDFERAMYRYGPGDSATVELLDAAGQKRSVRITFGDSN